MPHKIHPHLQNLKQSATLAINKYCGELETAGKTYCGDGALYLRRHRERALLIIGMLLAIGERLGEIHSI